MSALWVKNSSGTWVNPSKPWVRDSGIWKVPQKVFAKAAGTWSLIWQSIVISLSSANVFADVPSGTATATYGIRANGTVTSSVDGVIGTWINDATQVANYWVRATLVSGVAPTGSGTGAWLQCNADSTWTITRSTSGSTSSQLTVQIASDSLGTTIKATATVNLEASVA